MLREGRRAEGAVGSRLLPEMLFSSELSLTHEASGVALVFNATEALREWKAEALPPLRVACAAAWASGHEQRLREGTIREWGASALSATPGDEAAEDWTFTTPFGGAVQTRLQMSVLGGTSSGWRAVDERIDRSALLARDPILFYDELTLYESELDDNGCMSLTVKARGSAGGSRESPDLSQTSHRCASCPPAGTSSSASGCASTAS